MTPARILQAAEEAALFLEWIDSLDVTPAERRVLRTLVDRADERELVTGRCASMAPVAEIGRRSRVWEEIDDVLRSLVEAGYITMFSGSIIGARSGLGVIFRVRRPDVVLDPSMGANLWPEDTKVAKNLSSKKHAKRWLW